MCIFEGALGAGKVMIVVACANRASLISTIGSATVLPLAALNWISKEYNCYFAWTFNIDDGSAYNYGKGNADHVRAVRAF